MRLRFRITVTSDYPDSILKINIENYLKCWGFLILEWSETSNRDKVLNKPKFDDQIIQVESVSDRFFTDIYAEMDMLTTFWCSVITKCWLTLTTEESFHQTKTACHEYVNLRMFYYGTLRSQTEYIVHRYVKGVLYANFYHDTQFLQVRHRRNIYDNNESLLIITYGSMNYVVLDMRGDSAFLFIDVKYPPVTYSKGRRVLTFDYVDKEIHGKSSVLMFHIQELELAKEIVSRIHSCNNRMPINYGSIQIVFRKYLTVPSFNLGNFDCTYNLCALLTRNFILLEQIRRNWENFICEIQHKCNENASCLSKALEDIFELVERGVLCNYLIAIRTLHQWYVDKEQIYIQNNEDVIPANTKLIRRVISTPTRILLYPPEFQSSNRMLRNFNSDYTLRISFRDDDNKKLCTIATYSDDSLLDHAVKVPMIEGIKIGERHYQFLAWSNSQIRDHGVWMYAEDDEGNNVDTIRTWMGDFSVTKSVSKYMARMGQCFSHTEDSIKVPLDDRFVITENDIEGGFNPVTGKPYCFSDGIGKISEQLAKEVSNKLGLKKVPCAYQIRYAGYKGMLVLDPHLSDLGLQILFRKSMKKFESSSNQLEIIKISQAIPVQLNRPMINIMNQLGVPNETFMELQEDMLATITDMLTDDEKAADYLTSKITLNTITGFKSMVQAGIGLTGDPFFRGMLLCLRDRALLDIKTKARLSVSPYEGRNMFGVLDETATLNYGQVFIQYTKDVLNQEADAETVIYTGQVLVTKNPCTQPGDIRLLEAIDVPDLHHILDCIVFPQKGPRPHPNEMAGSDLDGDEYAVIWKRDLFFSENEPPEHFPSPVEDSQSIDKFNIHQTVQMLKEYIKMDQIGTIGISHLAISDRYGIDFHVCKEIARKFSLAVDYAKTGYLEPLTCDEKPRKYPDFMEKGTERETYSSNSALGYLYRNCKIYETKTISFDEEVVELKIDPDLVYPGWEKYEKSAEISRQNYNHSLQSLMQRYGIQTETEVVTGALRRLHERYKHRHDATDVEKIIIRSVECLQNRFRHHFYAEFGLSEESESVYSVVTEEILRKASAWYVTTYNSSSTRFLSFPWLVWRHLIILKTSRTSHKTTDTSITTILDNRLRCIAKQYPTLEDEEKLNIPKYMATDSMVVAHRLLIQWANRKKQLSNESKMQFTHYFFSIVQNNLHSEKPKSNEQRENVSNLCLTFLKAIRNNSCVPKELMWLSAYARDTYRILAATGNVAVFCPRKEKEEPEELIELKPIKVLSKILPGPKCRKIEVLRNILCSLVDLENLTVRSAEKNCLVVSAVGTWKSIAFLQDYFRVDTETLKRKLSNEEKKLAVR